MRISLKIPNEVISFVRYKVRMITKNQQSKKNHPYFHILFQVENQHFLRRNQLTQTQETSIFNGFRVPQTPKIILKR
jgi:plasmid rolling circle replication initiator protein Rep